MEKGIRDFAEVVALSERSRAKERSPWFYLICRAKAQCGKETYLMT
jgi:hypothetical protein